MTEQKDEFVEMLDDSPEPAASPAPSAEPTPPPTVPPVEPPPAAPSAEPAAPAAPAAPETQPASPAAPKTEFEIYKEQAQAREALLMEQIQKMTEWSAPAPAPVPTPTQAPASAPAPATEPHIEVIPFFKSEEEADDILNNAEKLNALLTRVVQHAVQYSTQIVPHVARDTAIQQHNTMAAVNEFYMNNKDLEPYKAFVKFVANDLIAANPNWSVVDLMREIGPATRKRLNMPEPQMQTPTPADVAASIAAAAPTPGFVPGGSGSPRQPAPTPMVGLEAEIGEMLKLEE